MNKLESALVNRQFCLWRNIPTSKLLSLFLIMSFLACARPIRIDQYDRELALSVMTDYMNTLIRKDYEGSFVYLDIDNLINYGNYQGDLYRSMEDQMRKRYRKDFSEGLMSFFFRNTTEGEEKYTIRVLERMELIVEITGNRPNKKLYFQLRKGKEGPKIVRIEKMLWDR